MTNGGDQLPPGFTAGWPPVDPDAFFKAITDAYEHRPGKTKGKHWAFQIYGQNPISGYRIIVKPCGPGDP